MPTSRRLRLRATLLLAALAIFVTIYVTSAPHATRDSVFYTRTADTLAREGDDATVQQRLRDAQDTAKKSAEQKADEFHGEEGRRRAEIAMKKVEAAAGAGAVADRGGVGAMEKVLAAQRLGMESADKAVEELNYILKRSPGMFCATGLLFEANAAAVIIFSKTYCPHSKKAKNILLDLYTITPPPHVVELDTHELGPSLQKALAETTGRKTVPNILVNGKSIGGGDEIEQLHLSNGLIQKIQELGGSRVQIVKGK
jgi:glutaredoxin